MKALIGITSSYHEMPDDLSKKREKINNNILSNACVKAVEKAGGIPLIIPIFNDMENIESLINRLDGIILTGGGDIAPKFYNEEASDKLKNIVLKRDRQEIHLIKSILKYSKLPILGICRGMQITNVALGGSLHQDLEDAGYNCHLLDKHGRDYPSHKVILEPHSILYDIFAQKEIGVNSFHHQAVKVLGEGLKTTAISEDGVIEGFEGTLGHRFIMGVQWHPEEMINDEGQHLIFKRFVEEG